MYFQARGSASSRPAPQVCTIYTQIYTTIKLPIKLHFQSSLYILSSARHKTQTEPTPRSLNNLKHTCNDTEHTVTHYVCTTDTTTVFLQIERHGGISLDLDRRVALYLRMAFYSTMALYFQPSPPGCISVYNAFPFSN